MRTLLTVAMLVGASALAGAQDRLADQLKKGVVQEEINQSPEKAMQAYRAIVAQYDEDRKVAATALFRLAECYRKAGMRAEAQAAYQRVIREFADQTALAGPSRRQLIEAYGVSEPRAIKESDALLRTQRELATTRDELERSRARELRTARELTATSERSSKPMSIEEAQLELAMTERRMEDIKAKIQIGVAAPEDLRMLEAQYARDRLRLAQLLSERETMQRERQSALTLNQQTLKSIEAEMKLIDQQLHTLQGRVETGTVSPADPQLLQLQRDRLALQRKYDEVRAAISK